MLVFVYGTLRRGEQYHGHLVRARFVATHRTAPEWHFWDLGSYPAVSPGGGVAVLGELYEVDVPTLGELDVLEGVPELYQRSAIETPHGAALIYVMRGKPAGRSEILGGDWVGR